MNTCSREVLKSSTVLSKIIFGQLNTPTLTYVLFCNLTWPGLKIYHSRESCTCTWCETKVNYQMMTCDVMFTCSLVMLTDEKLSTFWLRTHCKKKDMVKILTLSEWKGVDISKCWLNVTVKNIQHGELRVGKRLLMCSVQQLLNIMSASTSLRLPGDLPPSCNAKLSWNTSFSVWLPHLMCENCVGDQRQEASIF